jgi:two-component system OmpR family sensor kinase
VTKVRLTRHELSWLLTQEAQHAAERLRAGVQVLRNPQSLRTPDPAEDPSHHVDASLDALDDVMRMLSNLNQRQSGGAAAPRRGRIDLAALLVEIAPAARVSIEPGSGTEVYGEEADLRRMLQILVGHAGGEGASVTIRRDGDDVRVAVVLGPDSSPTAETERAWLSRMAVRYGGRHELVGGNELLSLPGEGGEDKSEREALQRELDAARRQGEAYARELAAMFDRGEEVASISTYPPAPGADPKERAAERFATITRLSGGVAAELRTSLVPAAKELAALRPNEVNGEQLDVLRRRLARAHEVVASIASVASVPPEELATEVDLGDVAREAARECAPFADRNEVAINVRVSGPARAYVRVGPKAVAALARELVAHAVQASPRGTHVEVTVVSDAPDGPRLVVDDAGAVLPASARRTFLTLESHAGSYGRPSALPVFMAAELAAFLGGRLELSDAPAGAEGHGGGLRASVAFPRR